MTFIWESSTDTTYDWSSSNSNNNSNGYWNTEFQAHKDGVGDMGGKNNPNEVKSLQ